jgi:histidyl-tRNA synthetase
MGMERFVALYAECGGKAPARDADVYLVAVGDEALQRAFALAEELRSQIEGIRVDLNLGGGSFKSQLKRADKSNAMYALILGEQELADGNIGLKPLRSTEDQVSVAMDEVANTLATRLG